MILKTRPQLEKNINQDSLKIKFIWNPGKKIIKRSQFEIKQYLLPHQIRARAGVWLKYAYLYK